LINANLFTVQQEAQAADRHATAGRKGVKDFFHTGRLFNFEESFFTRLLLSLLKKGGKEEGESEQCDNTVAPPVIRCSGTTALGSPGSSFLAPFGLLAYLITDTNGDRIIGSSFSYRLVVIVVGHGAINYVLYVGSASFVFCSAGRGFKFLGFIRIDPLCVVLDVI
jgi:hypothetical protein